LALGLATGGLVAVVPPLGWPAKVVSPAAARGSPA
jgi:hypothetical protein